MLERARGLEARGREIIHLEIGEPDFETAPHIREAAKGALDAGETHYGPAAGLPELRAAIAADVGARRGIQVDPAEVVVTPGGKPILFFTILALVEPGTEVLLPDPGFPIYASAVAFAGGTPVSIPLREERGFAFDLDRFANALSDRTRLVILNSPHNPTGGVLTAEDLQVIADHARTRGIPVLADEIYSRILYEGVHQSIIALPGMQAQTILLDGFSKTYAMTGWRLGYGVMPRPLAERVTRLIINSTSCTPAFVQRGGIAALTGDQSPVERMVAAFRRRRDLIVAGLNAIPGLSCTRPRGAFYAFPNVSALGRPSDALADFLLEEAGVAVLSGPGFGQHGEGYLRISYATDEADLRKALDRMGAALRRLA
ncbi:MAG: pyridoxal phosphate-dependent aminotransferase [Candidatus Methylomirabilales bacterium]